jgi:hypothetical protein
MTDNTIFMLINLAIILLIIWGLLLYFAVKAGKIPFWIKWWQPITRRIWSLTIDDSFSRIDKIQIDGLSFIIFGGSIEIFLLLFTILAHLQLFTYTVFMIIAGIVFLGSLRLQEWITYKVARRLLNK